MSPFVSAFAHEFEKVSARIGLKMIRRLVAKDTDDAIGAARTLAQRVAPRAEKITHAPGSFGARMSKLEPKTKLQHKARQRFDAAEELRAGEPAGVLKPEKVINHETENGRLFMKEKTPGSVIKPLGSGGGGEQASALVATREKGGLRALSVGRGEASLTKADQVDAKHRFLGSAHAQGRSFAPEQYDSFRSPTGHHVRTSEYVRDVKPRGANDLEHSRAKAKATKDIQDFAEEEGMHVTDLGSDGNVLVKREKDGSLTGKVVDPIVARSGENVHQQPKGPRKNLGETMRDAFNTDKQSPQGKAALEKYERELELARKKAERR